MFHRNWLAASKSIVQTGDAPGADSRAHQDPIFCLSRFLCSFILSLFHHSPSTYTYFPHLQPGPHQGNSLPGQALHCQCHLPCSPNRSNIQPEDKFGSFIEDAANIYQTKQHVPDYTVCTRLYSMYQNIQHVPDYTACTKQNSMYQTTQRAPDYTA